MKGKGYIHYDFKTGDILPEEIVKIIIDDYRSVDKITVLKDIHVITCIHKTIVNKVVLMKYSNIVVYHMNEDDIGTPIFEISNANNVPSIRKIQNIIIQPSVYKKVD